MSDISNEILNARRRVTELRAHLGEYILEHCAVPVDARILSARTLSGHAEAALIRAQGIIGAAESGSGRREDGTPERARCSFR